MLLEELSNAGKRLTMLDKKEIAIQDAERKAKNDGDFEKLTSEFASSIKKIKSAHDELGYSVTDETLQLLDDSLHKLKETIEAGVVDEDELSTVKQQISRKVNPALTKEWREYHSKKTNGVISKLVTIGSLAPDKNHIEKIRENISDSDDWNTLAETVSANTTRITRLKANIDEVNRIEEDLNLTDDIKQFISLVTRGKAKITDLNEEILAWIRKEKLEEKFAIRFK